MFKSLKRMVYQVSDAEKAGKWYKEILGKDPAFDSPIAVIFKIGDSSLSLVKGPDGLPADSGRLAAYWEVDDVDQSLGRLLEMGATEKSPPGNVLNIRTAQAVDPFGIVIGLTGGISEDGMRTIENRPSETAHNVALCRALASFDARFGARTSDPFSGIFLKENVKPVLRDETTRRSVIDTMISRPLYGYFIARSAFIDETFVRALRNRIPQIVFMGAGYDTRALRFENLLGTTRIFELDAPTTQNRKKECLEKTGTRVPRQVSFISVNFKNENFLEKLEDAGFTRSAATLFIWEGVTYYLPEEAIDRTLELIREVSAPKTGLCFDYMTSKLDSINMGEPFLSWINPERIQEYLEKFGFRLMDHPDAGEIGARYLNLSNGIQAEKPLPSLRLAYAEK